MSVPVFVLSPNGPLQWLVLSLLLAGVLLGSLRLLATRRARTLPSAALAGRLLLQPLLALALYLTLFPPALPRPAPATLSVLTARWQQAAATPDPEHTIALPEAVAADGFSPVIDLASALRGYPPDTSLHVLGEGLTARDRDAARGRISRFAPAPPLPGIVELIEPGPLRPGQPFAIGGRVAGIEGGRVSLLDPLAQPVDRATPDGDGRFVLRSTARGSGSATFTLLLEDADGEPRERLPLGLEVGHAAPLRLLLLAGAPSPELKYLRRWALDAGLELSSRITLSERLPQRRGAPALDAAALQAFDLVLLDDRAWNGLQAGERSALLAAVRDGLGLLLRLTADPTPREVAGLRALGFEVAAADIARSVRLAPTDPSSITATATESIPLRRRPLAVDAADSAVLLASAAGEPLSRWRAYGRGRVALWWLGDSYRLVLGGAAAQHGALWSTAVGTLARAGGAPEWRLVESNHFSGERVIVCGGAGAITAIAPDGSRTGLLRAAADGCAGYWPTVAGLHRIEQSRDRAELTAIDPAGTESEAAAARGLLVRDPADAAALHAEQNRLATARLAAEAPVPVQASSGRLQPGSPWPFGAAALLLFGLLGALERRERRPD